MKSIGHSCANTDFNLGMLSQIRFSIIVFQLNFLIYIILVYVIISKLRVDASRSRESYHLRLARSTLTLIPLMGTEYIIFAFVINDQDLQYIRYKIDLFFVSFQGFFVAVLFCFLNEEVKKEIKKIIRQKCFRVSQKQVIHFHVIFKVQ